MKEKNAYLTVEATMVLPLVLGVILFAVYILLFQYNRCLSELDAGLMAMWGSTLLGEEEELERQMKSRLREWYDDKYVAWETDGLQIGVKHNYSFAEITGQLSFPVPEWNFWNEENLWRVDASFRYMRLEPVDFVRMCKKLLK